MVYLKGEGDYVTDILICQRLQWSMTIRPRAVEEDVRYYASIPNFRETSPQRYGIADVAVKVVKFAA
jgi:hypothetical protein